MANRYLLVFPYHVQDENELESILDHFEEKGFIIHLFNEINPENFDLALLPDILQQV